MSTSVPITTSAVTVTDNGSTVAVSVASSAVSVNAGVVGPQGAVGPGVASGGTTGQVLVKASATNYDTSWTSSPTFGTATMTLGTATTLQAGTATLAAASIGSVTNTEISYLGGVTSGLQSQLAGKASTTHASTHAAAGADALTLSISQTTGLQAALDNTLLGKHTWVSGRYYSYPIAAFGSAAGTLNAALYVPIWVPQSCTLDRLVVEVTAGITSGSCRLGLYSNTTGDVPGSLIVDSGAIATTGTGFKEATISQAVTAGWYWMVYVPQTAAATVRTIISSLPPISSSTVNAFASCYYQSSVTGALPATATIGGASSGAPRLQVRIA